MKVIVHAPSYMVGRAADLAAFHGRDLEAGQVMGVLSAEHSFSIKRNKASISVWHHIVPNRAAIDPDRWEPA